MELLGARCSSMASNRSAFAACDRAWRFRLNVADGSVLINIVIFRCGGFGCPSRLDAKLILSDFSGGSVNIAAYWSATGKTRIEEPFLGEFFERAESLLSCLEQSLGFVDSLKILHRGGFTAGRQNLKQLGHCHSGQNCDDRDHDQQFDQRETRFLATARLLVRSLALHDSIKLLPGSNV